MDYADADYKDLYDYGPVSYKQASRDAALKKKETNAKRFAPKKPNSANGRQM